MGYTTEFDGSLTVTPPVNNYLMEYINHFNMTRRMKRDPNIIKEMDSEWKNHCFNKNLGPDGAYYVVPDYITNDWYDTDQPWRLEKPDADGKIKNEFGQANDKSVVNYNYPPEGQPGLWCQWCMPDASTLEWDEGEKFYYYTEWLEYLIKHFFEPSGHKLSGVIRWRGEEFDDYGTITVKDNEISVEYKL